MYKADPIVDVYLKPDIPVPFCMYALPRISPRVDPVVFDRTCKAFVAPSGDWSPPAEGRTTDVLDDILTRQRNLLKNLTLLQKRLEDLRNPGVKEVKSSIVDVGRTERPICAKPAQPRSPGDLSMVLRCNPDRPPHAVLDLLKLLRSHYDLSFDAHVHSSVRARGNLEALTREFTSNPASSARGGGGKPALNFTLIWFDLDGDCDFLVNPLEQRRVSGESNAARYLYRLLPGNKLSMAADPGVAANVDQCLEQLERMFLWNAYPGGPGKEGVALAKKFLSDRSDSANQLVSLLASSFLKNCAV